MNKKPFALAVILIIITSLTVYPVQNADAAKTVTVTQKCENAALELFLVNQEGKSAKNAKIFDHARMEVLASADENGFLVLHADLQGKPLRAGGGSYTLAPFTAENCQPSEIKFEKSGKDLVIVHHHTWSLFDPSQDYSDAPYLTPFTGDYVVGDILNLSEYPLTDIKITIQTISKQIGTIETKSWYPIKKILRPGEASPFFAYVGGGFDNYGISISDYKATSEFPVNPPVKISDIVINEDKDGNEFLTIICENTLEESDNLHLLLLGYSEHNLLDYATIETPFLVLEMGFGDSNCITDGQISTYEFLEYAKEGRFEAFIIQSGLNLFFDVQEISQLESLNAYQLKDYGHLLQTSVYSRYYPDSLTPKYMNVQEIKSMTERYHEIKKSRENGIILQDDSNRISSSLIPDWIRNNASWWVQGNIDDKAFVGGIQFLIQEGIIQIPETAQSTIADSQEIPSWIKNNADWWSRGLISDDDFLKGITFMIENGIIAV